MPASAIAIVPGEQRARMLIKGLLAHLERVWHQHWTVLDFPEDRIQSRPAVQVIAMEETGRTTALELISLEPLAAGDERTDWLLAGIAPLEQDPALSVPGFHVDVAVRLEWGPASRDLKLLASGLRGWCARRLATAPEGASSHVITVSGRPIRLQVEKTGCAGERGRLSIVRAEPPATFEAAVSARLHARLGTLLTSSADRHVLLFEKNNGLWSAGQLRTELEASLEFPELSRVHETWMVDTRASSSDDSPTFRRVMPVRRPGSDTQRVADDS
jgi:hypothetical protein